MDFLHLRHFFKQYGFGLLGLLLMTGLFTPQAVLSDPSKDPVALIVPNQSFGPITRNTRYEDLVRGAGAQNVKDQQLDLAEGEMEQGTVLYPNDPLKRVEIFWHDPQNHQTITLIRITGNKSYWKTKEGLTLGTPLKQVEKFNGKPFTLSGFDWDYGGNILDTHNGRLQKTFPGMMISFTGGECPKTMSHKACNSLIGDKELSSSLPAMQLYNPKVTTLSFGFLDVAPPHTAP